MLTRLSLRLRVFLFFGLMAAGAAALAGAALYFGWSRAEADLPRSPFVTAFVAFAFLNTGLLVGIWLLFDENLAKPISKLASDLLIRAHSDVDTDLDIESAKYLGDLAPAALAVARTMNKGLMGTAEEVARETQRLQSETERLTALLTELPVAMILVNPAGEIVLYDGQAADVLGRIAPPRLKAPLTDYFDSEKLDEARAHLTDTGEEVTFRLEDLNRTLSFETKISPLSTSGFMLTIELDNIEIGSKSQRPLVYDFDLLATSETREIVDTKLSDVCFVAFDTETTGLSPESDDVVQIGAVRILNRRVVAGEIFDTFVDPGRPIPPASTRVHGVSDADVSGAPDFVTAGRSLHHFARDSVLVAHNAPFDIAFLQRFEGQMGVSWNHPVLDTVLLSAVLFGTTEQHSLDALCDRLGITIPPERRHTALGDAQVTAEALLKMLPLLEGKGLTTFGDVIAETRKHGRLLQDLNQR